MGSINLMHSIIPAEQYRHILVSGRPLIDSRAPIEFNKGAFPAAINLPLMTDSERQKVGTCYKEQGQQAAIALGHQLVQGKIKTQRITTWIEFIHTQPNALLYCFRGGLRSRITQQWIKEAGVDIPYIEGGYKAMRQYLINTIEQAAINLPMIIISGITGSGKTDFIHRRLEAIDLEGIANHRGSSFGKKHEPQPSQINFENTLAVELLKHQDAGHKQLLLEDESFLIGRNAIPKPFHNKMQQADVVVLEEAWDDRLQRLLNEYVVFMYSGYVSRLGDEHGLAAFKDYLTRSQKGIAKRLGGKTAADIRQQVDDALVLQLSRNDLSGHLLWIAQLLELYYDPMYHFQMQKKTHRIRFKGNHQAAHEWLDNLTGAVT